MREASVLLLAARSGGWAEDRPRLPAAIEQAAIRLLGDVLPPHNRGLFLTYLQRIPFSDYGTRDPGSHRRKNWIRGQESPSNPKSTSICGRNKKLPTRLRDCLEAFRIRHRELQQRGALPDEICQYLEDIYQEQELFWVLNLVITERCKQHLVLFRREREWQPLFTSLGSVFDEVNQFLQRAERPGPSEPVFEQMARTLAALYLHCTGRLPKRRWDDYKEKETGHFTALCRLMARVVNQTLPPAARRKKAPAMVTTCRRVMKELADEQVAA